MATVGRFQSKVVIVTGGCNGIGSGIVKVFREHGGNVVIWDIDDPPLHAIDDYSADEMRKLMDLNFIGYFLAAKYTLPHLRKTKGAIVNISSITSTHGQRLATAYCATKQWVLPGATNTALMNAFITSDEARQEFEDMSALRRLGEPEEIGHVCLFLATDATFIIGQEIQSSGGMSLGTAYQYRS
ncbi:17-beta-hydroxysteroid dehydrogenase 14-like [Mya arenaria]|uniref:17-beta-hydroxysteroid dehydrogenase 14-like n=1 Tax=Mya arenaria TaxID=6604 RepID=UPI0022DFACFA|nr:17-beta-hydroxysteroid dehydrogenase 14-like [Mya arenaria]